MPKPTSPFAPELLDELLEGRRSQAGVSELMRDFAKALLERALNAELTHHLGHESGEPVRNDAGNERNGRSNAAKRP